MLKQSAFILEALTRFVFKDIIVQVKGLFERYVIPFNKIEKGS